MQYRTAEGKMVPISETPVEVFTNDRCGMRSFVFNSTGKKGGYNVTLQDLDSGYFVPGGLCNVPSLEVAIAYARKFAGVEEA